MIDGADGLLGGVSSISFGALGILFYAAGESLLALFCLLFVIAMVPYLVCNLELLRKQKHKVFMGDAGTFFVGFTIIWLLIYGSQHSGSGEHDPMINAATALWIIALPLMDMAMVMLRRMRKKQSPFSADRLHLHHIFQRMGISKGSTLTILVLFSLVTATIGVVAQLLDVPEYVMFYLFLLMFVCYVIAMNHVWRISVWIRKNARFHSKQATLPY
jgi:UDP-GlcNAc:undecaprenyl-phosphate GlcNAc-1-phosphate transferase